MHVTDIELIPVAIPTRPLDEELGLAPYIGGGDVDELPEQLTFEEALDELHHVEQHREVVLVRVETDVGITGWGELPYYPDQAQMALETVIEPNLVGRPVWDIEPFVEAAAPGEYQRRYHLFVGGVEMALWDALGKEAGKPVYELLGGKRYDSAPVAFCLGLLSPEESRRKAREARDHGFSVLKTKASRYWETDVARIEAMHDEVDGELEFRLDPNRQWSVNQALRVGAKLEAAGIYLQYLEQPIAGDSFDQFASLRQRLSQPIAINEDAYLPVNIYQSLKRDAIDVAVVDLQPAGGILRMKRLAMLGSLGTISLAHHSDHDLGLKNAAKLHLMASTPEFDLPFDSTYYAAETDVLEEPLQLENGRMRVPEKPGLAGDVDESVVEEHRVD